MEKPRPVTLLEQVMPLTREAHLKLGTRQLRPYGILCDEARGPEAATAHQPRPTVGEEYDATAVVEGM